MKEIRNIIQRYESASSEEQLALASVVHVEESSYRRIGARMLVSSNGEWIGGISGGCLEGDALKRSQKAIFNNRPSTVVYDTMDGDRNQIGVGLGCNGLIEVLFTPIVQNNPENEIEQLKKAVAINNPALLVKVIEADQCSEVLGRTKLITDVEGDNTFLDIDLSFTSEVWSKRKNRIVKNESGQYGLLKILVEFLKPETRLMVIGDNYDVHAMVGLAEEMGWEIYVVGRAKKLPKYVFNTSRAVVDFDEVDRIPRHSYTVAILMTHDYNIDKRLLPQLIKYNLPYLGMLGPKKRYDKMIAEVGPLDIPAGRRFCTPVGLEIGAETPEEIALAVLAEIISVFRDKPGTSLIYKDGTIHDRI